MNRSITLGGKLTLYETGKQKPQAFWVSKLPSGRECSSSALSPWPSSVHTSTPTSVHGYKLKLITANNTVVIHTHKHTHMQHVQGLQLGPVTSKYGSQCSKGLPTTVSVPSRCIHCNMGYNVFYPFTCVTYCTYLYTCTV